jgi:2-isopropylmalate synthase
MFVTEDTTRADPETIRALYTTAIRCGARAVCVCDTVGHATPDGARAVVRFVKASSKSRASRFDSTGTAIRIGA